MSRPIPHTVPTDPRGSNRPVTCEALESRTLFSVHLQLNNNVLFVTEDFPGVNNFTIFKILNNGNLQVNELSDNMLGNTALFTAGWTASDDLRTFSGPQTAISAIVIDLTDGS